MRQSALGLIQRAQAQEVLSNNLANINTPGFRGDRVSFAEALEQAAGKGALRSVAVTSIDLRPGPVETTGNDLDFAVDGAGFFVVQTPQGERYTRGGAFTLDGEGKLVTRSGYPVLTDGGPVVADSGDLMVAEDGTVSVGGEPAGRLRLVSFADGRALRRWEGGLFEAVGRPVEAEGRILQGHLEGSNVSPVEMLTEMMTALRQFEANQKALREQSDTAEKLIGEAGR
jgi:flagellar basal-body rod protein FlgF